MAIYTNTFESGTNGTNITTGNSGGASGTAFNQVTTGITYTTDAMHGSMAATTTSSATEYLRWSNSDGPILLRSYHKFSSLAGQVPVRMSFGTGTIHLGMLTAGNLGRMQLYQGSGLATSPSAISPNTWYRFELYIKAGSGSGEARVAVYVGDSTTAWWDSGLITGLTIDSIVNQYVGKFDTNSSNATWDSVGVKTASDAVWGAWPASSSSGPTLTVTRPAANLADLRTSTSGDASSLTYNTPVRVSGPTLTVSSLASGLWLFSQDASTDAVYTVCVTQGDAQTASQNITIAAQSSSSSSTNVAAPKRLISAPPSTNWG